MAINGEFSIFRFSLSSNTETLISDKIEFNGDAVLPDGRSQIQHVLPVFSIPAQENETPDSNNPNSLDETGLAFVGLEITGYFIGNESVSPLAIRFIRNWMKADKKLTIDFEFGRFGFRNNKNNEFDIVPSATSGYVLEHFDCDLDYTTGNRFPFTIKLRFDGDIAGLGSLA